MPLKASFPDQLLFIMPLPIQYTLHPLTPPTLSIPILSATSLATITTRLTSSWVSSAALFQERRFFLRLAILEVTFYPDP